MTNSSNWSYHLVFIFELGLMSCSQHYYQVRDIELKVESSYIGSTLVVTSWACLI